MESSLTFLLAGAKLRESPRGVGGYIEGHNCEKPPAVQTAQNLHCVPVHEPAYRYTFYENAQPEPRVG